MMMRVAPLLGLAVLAACAPPGGTRDPAGAAAGPDLAIHSDLDFSSLPTEGEIGTFIARIKNGSKRYIILRDLVEPGAGPILTWQVSRSGTLSYDQRSGQFEYDGSKRAGQPRPAFNTALLCPGEEIVIRPKIRLLHLPRRYLVNYFALETKDVSSSVYFEKKVDRRTVYARLFGTDLDLALVPVVPPRPEPGKKPIELPPVATHRTVVFPHAETLLQAPLQERLDLDVRLDVRTFRLPDAAAKAGTTVDQVGSGFTYWSAVDAWVLRGPNGPVMVNPRGLQALPEISNPEAFFYLLDTIGSGAVTFHVRSPLEMRLQEKGFRIMPAPCRQCGASLRRTGDRPPVQCESCKAWLVIPTACKGCGGRIDLFAEKLPVKCPTCGEKLPPVEDAYRYQLHAGRADFTPVLRFLAEEKLRIDVSAEAGGVRLVIRR